MKFYISIITILLCSLTFAQTNQNKKEQIISVLKLQESAWNSGNIEEYMQGYLMSDSLRFASGGNVNYGWEKTLMRYKKGYPDKQAMGKLSFSDLDVKLITDNVGLVFGKWSLKREKDNPWGLFTLIFRKGDDGWKIIHDHTSSGSK